MLTEHDAPIAPSTCYAAKSRPASARAVRDGQLKAEIRRVWKDNCEVYGADKVWLELNRQGIGVARCTTERLIRELGLQGVRRGRKVRTTVPGTGGHRAACLLWRNFTAPAPNRRYVADFTYVATWAAMVYVLVRRGYLLAGHRGMGGRHAQAGQARCWMPCRWRCGGVTGTGAGPGPGLVHNSDAGSPSTPSSCSSRT